MLANCLRKRGKKGGELSAKSFCATENDSFRNMCCVVFQRGKEGEKVLLWNNKYRIRVLTKSITSSSKGCYSIMF